MLTRFACPPEMPRCSTLPMVVSAQPSRPSLVMTCCTRASLSARDVAGGALGARGDARYGGGEDGDAQGEAVALKLMRTRAECVREIYLPLHFVRILLTI